MLIGTGNCLCFDMFYNADCLVAHILERLLCTRFPTFVNASFGPRFRESMMVSTIIWFYLWTPYVVFSTAYGDLNLLVRACTSYLGGSLITSTVRMPLSRRASTRLSFYSPLSISLILDKPCSTVGDMYLIPSPNDRHHAQNQV